MGAGYDGVIDTAGCACRRATRVQSSPTGSDQSGTFDCDGVTTDCAVSDDDCAGTDRHRPTPDPTRFVYAV
jgi:hypothetical protein